MKILSASPAARGSTTPAALLRTLESAQDQRLDRSVLEIAGVIGRVANRFLDPTATLRRLALEGLREEAGLTSEMAVAVLDGMARDWTAGALERLLRGEFRRPAVLDTFVDEEGRELRAMGRSPAIHVTSGNVPGVGVTSMIRGLLVKSAVLLKPGAEDRHLSSLFLDALAAEDPALASAAAVVQWDPDSPSVHEAVGRAEMVVVYGGAEAIRWVRSHAAPHAQVLVYPHRISAAIIMADQDPGSLHAAAASVGKAVALFDQRGCVSPHTVYVVTRSPEIAAAFADALAQSLAALDSTLPPGVPLPGEASAFHQAAGTIELEAASGAGPIVHGVGERWRVVLEPRPGFRGSCLGRFVWVRSCTQVELVAQELSAVGSQVQTLGVCGELPQVAREQLARIGVRRFAKINQAPWPAAWTRHDGVAPLHSLVRWVEVDDPSTSHL